MRVVVQAAEDLKVEQVSILGLEGLAAFTDYLIVASAPSRAQMRAVTREVRSRLAKAGLGPPRVDGENSDHWVVLDLGDVVVHLFDPQTRVHYNLEGLWGDAQSLDTAGILTA